MRHLAEVWKDCEDLVRSFASDFPSASLTCIRDIYGRCSFAAESLDEPGFDALERRIDAIAGLARPGAGARRGELARQAHP
jgi:hypothetical protein